MPLNDIFVRALSSLQFRKKQEEDKKKIVDSLQKPVFNEREFSTPKSPTASDRFVESLKTIRDVAKQDFNDFSKTLSYGKSQGMQGFRPVENIDKIIPQAPAVAEKVGRAAGHVAASLPGLNTPSLREPIVEKVGKFARGMVETPEETKTIKAKIDSGQPLTPEEKQHWRESNIQLVGGMADGIRVPDVPTKAPSRLSTGSILGTTKKKPSFTYTPAELLDEPSRTVEKAFGRYLTDNFDTAVQTYRQKFGNVINTDNARELSADYTTNKSQLSAAVHEPASAFSKNLYEQMLKEAPGPGQRPVVLFTAGGTGAGKTTAINLEPEFKTTAGQSQIVYDTNMNTYDSSKKKIEQALTAGKDVKIVYVLRDPIDALVNGAVPRAQRMGRTVPIDAHVDTHVGALETIKKLATDYATNEHVDISVIDNSFGRGNQRELPLDALKNVSYNKDELRKNVQQTLDQLYTNQKLDPELYQGFTGKAPADLQRMEPGSNQGYNGQPPQEDPSGQRPAVELGPDGKLRSTQPPEFQASLNYYDTPDAVKKTIEDIANQSISDVQTARRGALSFKETRALADSLGMDVSDLEKRQPGKLWNAEQADAATRLMIGVNEKLTEVSQQVRQFKESGQDIPEDLILKQADLATQAQAVTAAILGDNAEAGRALNIRKMMKAALETNDSKARKQAIKMFGGDKKKSTEIIKRLSEFEPEDNLGRAKFLRSVKPSTPLEMIEEYWYNSVLSNTSTHVVNTVSNGIASLMSIPEKAVAGTIDATVEAGAKLLGKAYKRDRYVAEAAAEVAGLGAGIKQGIRKAAFVLRNGVTEDGVSKMEIGRPDALKGPLGSVINVPSRLLAVEDELFKGINYQMELQALATRTARQEGLQGAAATQRAAELLAEPTPQMITKASEKAKYKTFQAQSNLADGLRTFRDKVSVKIPKGGEFKPLRFIIPFIQTPVNVVKYGLERSPAGLIGTTHKLATGAAKEEVIDSASRALLGSAVMIPLAMYFTEEKITGAPPKDRTERDAFYKDGKLPYSVKIGNDWVAYNRIEPLNTILTQIAMWHDSHEAGSDTTVEQISDFLRAEARNIADQTFMTGIGNLVDAIEDPERYGKKFMTDIIGGFIPSLAAAGARANDDTVRLPETVGQSLLARIPGQSQKVPAQPSEFEEGGEAIRYTNQGMGRNFASNFLGFRSTPDQGTDYQEQVQSVKSADQERRAQADEMKLTAESILQEVKDAPPEQRATLLEQKMTEGSLTEDVATKLIDQVKTEATEANMDTEAKLLKDYPNETKARYLYDKLKSLPAEDRKDWVTSMLEQKAITEDTVVELSELIRSKQTEQNPALLGQ